VQENINIQNKKAKFKYFIEKKYIAGLVLTGLQIKSIRYKKANIDNSYCTFDSDELFLYNTNFENNLKSNTIKLLLNKKELIKIKKETNSPGITIIPLKIFINDNGFAKVQICIAKGKRNYDKRETIKKREAKVKISRILKRN
jgi:SsrA-binding protein|tara:strand:+ start:1642 stop:2070 length:429 start_codon:yes stop_codon:yes gene_type:complete